MVKSNLTNFINSGYAIFAFLLIINSINQVDAAGPLPSTL